MRPAPRERACDGFQSSDGRQSQPYQRIRPEQPVHRQSRDSLRAARWAARGRRGPPGGRRRLGAACSGAGSRTEDEGGVRAPEGGGHLQRRPRGALDASAREAVLARRGRAAPRPPLPGSTPRSMASAMASSSSAPAAPSVWPICALNGCTTARRAPSAPERANERARLGGVVERRGRGVRAHEIDRRRPGLRQRGRCGAREPASAAIGRGQMDRVGRDAEPRDNRPRRARAGPRERQHRRALAERHPVAIDPKGTRRRRRGHGAKRFEPGRHEDGDVVESAGEHHVAGLALEPARRKADGDGRRRARSEDEHGRVERTAEPPHDARHRAEVRRSLDVASPARPRERGERSLRRAHAPARRSENEADALLAPCGPRPVQVGQAAAEGRLEERRGAISAVVESSPHARRTGARGRLSRARRPGRWPPGRAAPATPALAAALPSPSADTAPNATMAIAVTSRSRARRDLGRPRRSAGSPRRTRGTHRRKGRSPRRRSSPSRPALGAPRSRHSSTVSACPTTLRVACKSVPRAHDASRSSMTALP